MNRRCPGSWFYAGLLALALAALTGCVSGNPDDSDIPWNVGSPNEGVPTLPGLNP